MIIKLSTLLFTIFLFSLLSCGSQQKTLLQQTVVHQPQVYSIGEWSIADSVDYFVLSGRVIEANMREPLLFASVGIYHENKIIAGTETDFDGHYSIKLHTSYPKELAIEFSYFGFQTQRVEKISVMNGKQINVDATLYQEENLHLIPITTYCPAPMVSPDDFGSGQTFTSDQIRRSGIRSN